MLGKFLDFFVHHIEIVIEVLFSSVLIFTLFLLYRSFKDESDNLDTHISEMESLEDILKDQPPDLAAAPSPVGDTAKTATVSVEPVGGAPAAASAVGIPPLDTKGISADQVAALKEKESLIQQLNEKLKALEGASAQGNVNVKDYEQKINDLKDRLAEYEIIEDDIANLSFYKSENARLKDELSKHGVTVPQPVTAPNGAKMEAAPAGASSAPAATVATAPSPPPPTPATEPPPNNVVPFPEVNNAPKVEVDIMKEFEAAVKQKDDLETAASKVLSMKKASTLTVSEDDEPPKVAPPPPTAAPAPKSSGGEADILKEFGQALGVPVSAPTPAAAAPAPGFVAESPKSEKLLEEIGKMASEPPPAAKKEISEADESKKLISEFEEFVRKSSS